MKTKSNMTVSKLQSKAVKLFKEKFGIKSILHKIDGTMEIKYLIDEKQEQFLSDQIQKAYEAGGKNALEEILKMKIEDDIVWGDGVIQPILKPVMDMVERYGLSIQSKEK